MLSTLESDCILWKYFPSERSLHSSSEQSTGYAKFFSFPRGFLEQSVTFMVKLCLLCSLPCCSGDWGQQRFLSYTVYPNKYAHGFVVLCFVVVMQSFILNSHEVFIHIHQGCFAGTGAIVRLPQCQWSKPDGYGKISQCTSTIFDARHQWWEARVKIETC